MNQVYAIHGPRLVSPGTSSRLDVDWAEQCSKLLGVSEEYQSSAASVAHLQAAICREPRLNTVLQSPLSEMQEANQSLRQELMGLLNGLIGRIEGGMLNVDGGRSGD